MKKTILSLALAAALCLSLAVPALAAGGFADVPADAYYADAVAWAVEQGVTAGTSETTFSPDLTCTRGQIITFLWRWNGSPEPGNTGGVRDIAETDYFYKAVLWAKEKGAFESDVFRPNDPCTRLAAVEFLWHICGKDYAGSADAADAGFSDVSSPAVNWAVARGFVTGTSASSFSPDQTCTRGQIVTMMYRDISWRPSSGSYFCANTYSRLELDTEASGGGGYALYHMWKKELLDQGWSLEEIQDSYANSEEEETLFTRGITSTLNMDNRRWDIRESLAGPVYITITFYKDYVIVTAPEDSTGIVFAGKYMRQ